MNKSILCVLLVGISLIASQQDLRAQGFGGLGTGGVGTPTTLGGGGGGVAGRGAGTGEQEPAEHTHEPRLLP